MEKNTNSAENSSIKSRQGTEREDKSEEKERKSAGTEKL